MILWALIVTALSGIVTAVVFIANGMKTSGEFVGRDVIAIAWMIAALCWLAWAIERPAHARDDGRYANSPLKQWFDTLRSGKGPCCSDADGYAVADPDWESKDGHYRVRIEGEWYDVPPDALITEPNRAGRTMVWPIKGWGGLTIRCFMPGAMT